MTEYGVLLMESVVAPTASLVEAVVYSRGADREVCARETGTEWSIIEPAKYKNLRIDCLAPSHRAMARHRAAREPACDACLAYDRAYRRGLKNRRKAA
jgi:hypothetical protein